MTVAQSDFPGGEAVRLVSLEVSLVTGGGHKTIADVEYATAGWVDSYNARRLHSTLGNVPPIEYEQDH